MKNILVGINHSEHTPILVKYALKIAQFFVADLTAAHVIKLGSLEVSQADLMNSKLPNTKQKSNIDARKIQEKQRLEEVLQNQYGKEFSELIITSTVSAGMPSEELAKIAQQEASDLLMITSQNESKLYELLVGNTVTRIIENAPCPVLLIPAYTKYHGINRIVYSSNFNFGDMEALLFLQEWANVFRAKLVVIHVCKTKEEKDSAERKMGILKRLFPKVETHLLQGQAVNAIDDYLTLTRADMVATTMRDRTFWQSVFEPSITKNIAQNVSVPMMVFKGYK